MYLFWPKKTSKEEKNAITKVAASILIKHKSLSFCLAGKELKEGGELASVKGFSIWLDIFVDLQFILVLVFINKKILWLNYYN